MNKFSFLLYVIFLNLIVPVSTVTAQLSENDFIHYTVAEGLSDNFITGITQNARGFIWISTSNGLNRFDGTEIKKFYQQIGKESLLIDKLNGVEIGKENLMVYSRKGAQIIDLNRNSFLILSVSDNVAASFQNFVYDAAITANGRYALSTGTGFYVFDSSGHPYLKHDFIKPDSSGNFSGNVDAGRFIISLNDNCLLHFDSKDHIYVYDVKKNTYLTILLYKAGMRYIASFDGKPLLLKSKFSKNQLIFYDPLSHQLIIYNATTDSAILQTVPAWLQKEINWETKWLTINDTTALIFKGSSGLKIVHINPHSSELSFDQKVLFRNFTFNSVFVDRNNRLWLGSDKGMLMQSFKKNILKTRDVSFINADADKAPIPVQAFLNYRQNLYVGCHDGSPVLIINNITEGIKKVSFKKLSSDCNKIWSIMHYDKDTLWFATQDGLVWYNDRNNNFGRINIKPLEPFTAHQPISLMFKDSHGQIWLQGKWGSGLTLYNPVSKTTKHYSFNSSKNKLPLHTVNFATEDASGNVWFAEYGLTRWNRSTEKFDTLITSYYGFNKSNRKVTSLNSDKSGNLVFCNENNGVMVYNTQTNTYFQYATNNGLEENAAYQCLSTFNGYLWVATHNYITCINENSGSAISYSYADNLPATPFNCIYHDQENLRVVFGYDNFIVSTADIFSKRKTKHVSFFIDEVKVSDSVISLFPGREEINLRYKQNDVSIHFSAINFDNPADNRYSYKLGIGKWYLTGKENVLHFYNLTNGTHEISIKLSSVSGSFNDIVKKVVIKVEPPFWKKDWFIVGSSLLLITFLFALINWREKLLQNLNREKVAAQHLQNEQLKHRLELEQINNYFTTSVANKNNKEDILWDVARNLIGKLGFVDCMMYLWNEDKTTLVQIAGYGPKGSIEEINKLPFDVVLGQGVVGYVAQTKKAVMIDDTSKDPRYRVDEMIRLSEICVPILYKDELIGVIDSEYPEKNFFKEKHLEILTTISALIASKITSIESEGNLLKKKTELAELNSRLAEAEMKALHAQMNPHFIFNALNSIKEMILNNENMEASHYLSKFAFLIRTSLEASTQSLITLSKTIDYLERYIQIEQLRTNSFNCTIEKEEVIDANDTLMPPMLIQPFIENAIWHSTNDRLQQVIIKVSFKRHQEFLMCTIDDTGIGINASLLEKQNNENTHYSIGIQNVVERIKMMNEKYNQNSRISIVDKNTISGTSESGTRVVLMLSLLKDDI